MKQYSAIIYDIDGTILDTLRMNMIPLQKIIKEELNEDWSYDKVLSYAPYPGMKVMEELKVSNPEQVYKRWVSYVNTFEEGAVLFEGMKEVLDHFHGICRQAVVSAKTKKQYEIDFISKGLDHYIEAAVLADDTKLHKPHPEPILKCLKLLQLPNDSVLYIGDAASDYMACQNAGVDFGYATWGSLSDEGIVNPAYTFYQPSDIITKIHTKHS